MRSKGLGGGWGCAGDVPVQWQIVWAPLLVLLQQAAVIVATCNRQLPFRVCQVSWNIAYAGFRVYPDFQHAPVWVLAGLVLL